jgi:hypothetical protein
MTTTSNNNKKFHSLQENQTVVNQLLKQNIKSFQFEDDDFIGEQNSTIQKNTTTSTTKWVLPLPLPIELESIDRMHDLIKSCELIYDGIKVRSYENNIFNGETKFTLMDSYGDLVWLEVEFTTSLALDTGRHITNLNCPGKVPIEFQPFVEYARARNCLRTLLIGFGEYVRFCRKRDIQVRELKQKAPQGTVLVEEGREEAGVLIMLSDPQVIRQVSLLWIAEFFPNTLSDDSMNEFLQEQVYLTDFRIDDNNLVSTQLEEISKKSMDALIRLCDGNICEAALLLIHRMSKEE